MIRSMTLLVSSAFVCAGVVHAEEKAHRELGAHVHGQGTLNIAIDGKKVEIELEAPGADIVGFEHVASTDAQKAAVEKAKTTLADVLTLFKMPAAAGCKLDSKSVEARKEEHHDGDEDHDHEKGEPEHSEFHATYAITCAAPERLTGLETVYFANFSGAQLLNVNITTSKGQTQAQLSRDKTKLDLAGVM